jgi:hypothetical protein
MHQHLYNSHLLTATPQVASVVVMGSALNLEDINQVRLHQSGAFCHTVNKWADSLLHPFLWIWYRPTALPRLLIADCFLDKDDEVETNIPLPSHQTEYDLPDGEQLRLDAYRNAWKKSLDRMQVCD